MSAPKTSTFVKRYLSTQKRGLLLLTALILASIVLQIVNPQIIRLFIDLAQESAPVSALIEAAALYMGIAIIQQTANIFATWVGQRVSWGATNQLREDLALHCLKLDMSFHKTHTPGAMIERIDGDVNELGHLFSSLFIAATSNLLLIFGIIGLLFFEDWRIGAVALIAVLLAVGIFIYIQPHAASRWEAARQMSADVYGFIEERINGREEIRPNGGGQYVIQQLMIKLRAYLKAENRALQISGITSGIPNFTLAIIFSAAIWFGKQRFDAETLSLGSLFLIFTYLNLIVERAWDVVVQAENYQRALGSIGRISELLQIQTKIEDNGQTSIANGSVGLTFDQVSFAYADDDVLVLDDISFSLKPGEVLGLIGRTGSGKTTLIRLIFRLFEASKGQITLGDTNISNVPLVELRHRIGMVTQEVQLFQANLRDNLTFFDDSLDDQHIINVLNQCGLDGWFATLPNGLDTKLSADGQGLSAGQGQLIAFARVFLHDPQVVILDEASSRLDPATEQLLEEAIDKLLKGRTAIIIAHRLKTVERADQILMLDKGKILELGQREKLVQDPSSQFSQLLTSSTEAGAIA